MASVRKEVVINASPDHVWAAARDVGALHERLVRGFVLECRMEGNARVIRFANGVEARELIVSVDDEARRVVWSSVGGRLSHHNASLQVFAEGAGTRAVWIADLLPDKLAAAISGMMEQGIAAMKTTLENPAAR